MKDPKYFTPLHTPKRFFSKVKVGDLIEYSLAFMLDDIIKIAAQYGFRVEYKGPSTKVYKKYGSLVVKVVGLIEAEKPVFKPVLFDINMLDTPMW
jgi:hypothetical protein